MDGFFFGFGKRIGKKPTEDEMRRRKIERKRERERDLRER